MAVKVGERQTAVLGTCAVVASMAAYMFTASSGGIALVEIALVLSGIGMGVASPSIAASIANVVDQDALGTASAMQQLVVQIATVAGIQVFQTVQASVFSGNPKELLGSFHVAFFVGGSVALVGVLCAVGLHSTVRADDPLDQRSSPTDPLRGQWPDPARRFLRRDVAEAHCEFLGSGPGRAALELDQLRDVSFDLDLARHERLHGDLGVALYEDAPRRGVVDSDHHVDRLDVS